MTAVSMRLNPAGAVCMVIFLLCSCVYLFGLPEWFKTQSKISMRELLSVSIDMARMGGLRVKEVQDSKNLDASAKGLTKEGAKEMLTNGDTFSHRVIYHGLEKAFPGIRIISEEHDIEPVDLAKIEEPQRRLAEVEAVVQGFDRQVPQNQVLVWIDPLDATQEYTEKLNQYVTTMVCVTVSGKPTIGVIYRPFQRQLYWGWVGVAHSANLSLTQDRATHPSSQSDASRSVASSSTHAKKSATEEQQRQQPVRIVISRSHEGSRLRNVLRSAFGDNIQLTPAGGAGYKVLELVHGHADAYVHMTGIKMWDICAGDALLASLGGQLTRLSGDPIDYSAASPVVEGGILASLTDHRSYLAKLSSAADASKQFFKSFAVR